MCVNRAVSFFACATCGDVDHTALTTYWAGSEVARRDDDGPFCSHCDPRRRRQLSGRRHHDHDQEKPDGRYAHV